MRNAERRSAWCVDLRPPTSFAVHHEVNGSKISKTIWTRIAKFYTASMPILFTATRIWRYQLLRKFFSRQTLTRIQRKVLVLGMTLNCLHRAIYLPHPGANDISCWSAVKQQLINSFILLTFVFTDLEAICHIHIRVFYLLMRSHYHTSIYKKSSQIVGLRLLIRQINFPDGKHPNPLTVWIHYATTVCTTW